MAKRLNKRTVLSIILLTAVFGFSGLARSRGANALPGDVTLRPLTASAVTDLIERADLNADSNSALLDRAANSGLQQVAYDEYSKRYASHPDGFFENLWKGKASRLLAYKHDLMKHAVGMYNDPLYQEAVDYFEKAVHLRPHSAIANAYLGQLLFKDADTGDEAYSTGYGAYSKASVEMMRRAITYDPRCIEAHVCLAQVYSEMDSGPWINPLRGQHEYELAMALDPTSATIRLALIKDAVESSDRQAGLKALKGIAALVQGNEALTKEVMNWEQVVPNLPVHAPLPPSTQDPVIPSREQMAQIMEQRVEKYAAIPPVTSHIPRPSIIHEAIKTYVYAPISGKGVIDQYEVQATGSLAALPVSQAECGLNPTGMVVSTDSKYAYVTCRGDTAGKGATLWQYQIKEGMLRPLTPATIAIGGTPVDIARGEKSEALYVLLYLPDHPCRLARYSPDANGLLSAVPTAVLDLPVSSNSPGSPYSGILLNKAETLLFIADQDPNRILTCHLDKNGKFGAPLVTALPNGYDVASLSLHPSGLTLYAACAGSGGLVAYNVSPEGSLQLAGKPLEWYAGFDQFVIDPQGKFGYALSVQNNAIYPISIASDGSISSDLRVEQDTDPIPEAFTDPTTGKSSLAAKNTYPIWLIADPTGRYLYLANGIGTITQYRVMTDGTLVFLHPATIPVLGTKFHHSAGEDDLLNPPVTLTTAVQQ